MKKKKKEKRKLMAWIEMYGSQRSLAFELTTAIFWVEIHKKMCAWCYGNYGRLCQ